MVPVEAETQPGGEGHVFVLCENGHEDQFPISYKQAQELGLHWTRDLPETGG